MAPTVTPINKASLHILNCQLCYTGCYKMLVFAKLIQSAVKVKVSPFHLLTDHMILPIAAILGLQRPTAENIQTGSYRGTVEPSGPLT